ncbi:ribbon-helix-helix protein, CopG family [Sphingobium sp. UBA5915]|uniref:CopG family ribbon-helix-helix protein n=1 Tax=uncultured Sphingobium sp. TaxID=316087 RepID=UPI001D18421A|nr:ribbon-helix-helix protein, CopG family [Sphingobium sp. UBA5915]MCC4257123.1 ribbon-helix-helix protein, CopG family [Sphingobium lactosutens]
MEVGQFTVRYCLRRKQGHGSGDIHQLDDALKGRARQLAEVRRRSSHWIMREAIAQYVEREEKREAL